MCHVHCSLESFNVSKLVVQQFDFEIACSYSTYVFAVLGEKMLKLQVWICYNQNSLDSSVIQILLLYKTLEMRGMQV